MGGTSVIFGAFLGVAAIFGLTACVLLPIMRRRFLVWVIVRTLAFGVMAVVIFSTDFDPAPFAPLTRIHLAEIALAIAVACSGPLLASYIEDDLDVGQLRALLTALCAIGLMAAIATVLARTSLIFDAVHDALLLVTTLTICWGLWRAIAAGSRVARFQAAAWLPFILVGLVSLSYELLSGAQMPNWPLAVLIALSIDFLGTAGGVVDGFMNIVRQRDEAIEDVRAARIAVATDPLTGIANRRGLALRFRDPQPGRPSGLAVFDCDHFKRVNDQYGHDVGDEVLIAVAAGLACDEVFCSRQGGEEFVVLFYGDDWQRRVEAVRRRLTIAVLEAVPEVAFPVTASAGFTPVLADDTLDTATKRADRALYAAKDMGRDRCVFVSGEDRLPPRLFVAR